MADPTVVCQKLKDEILKTCLESHAKVKKTLEAMHKGALSNAASKIDDGAREFEQSRVTMLKGKQAIAHAEAQVNDAVGRIQDSLQQLKEIISELKSK